MPNQSFSLRVHLPADQPNPETHLEPLLEAGCDDATIGLGAPGRLRLAFDREAATLEAAIASAYADVRRAIPGARIESLPPEEGAAGRGPLDAPF